MDNETWVVEEGDRIMQKKARLGVDRLTDWERLVYSLWVADYGMRNAGDLGTARDVYAEFQSVALQSATKLSLPTTCSAFVLEQDTLKERYFELFEAVCAEIRSAEPNVPLFADLSEADPAVVEAMNEARRTLPLFLDAVSKTRFSEAMYVVKVPFIDRSDLRQQALVRTAETAAENPARPTCHLWLSVNSILDDLIFCTVAEAPDALQLKSSSSFVVASELIEDWMINQDGTAYGGFSLRVIRCNLLKEDQLKFDAHTGIHEFKNLTP
jgi:uncharacterized protein YegJ (DUF2314 family)